MLHDTRHPGSAERDVIQGRSQSWPLQERHREARRSGGTDPGIHNADHPWMLDGSQRGHLVGKPVANPALVAPTAIEDLHGKPGAAVSKIARFIDHRKAPARHNPAQLIAFGKSFSRIIMCSGYRAGGTAEVPIGKPPP